MLSQQEKQAAIDHIAAENGGNITPELVVAAASKPSHVLHGVFDWDDARAANKHRLDTARNLIASCEVRIMVDTMTIDVVGYTHDPRLPSGEAGYVATTQLAKRREDARRAAIAELQRVISAINRARSLCLGLNVSEYFEAILEHALMAKAKIATGKKSKAAAGLARSDM